MVFRVGELCAEFHITVIGQVKLFAISAAGQEKVIELVGPGNTFAEALMFTGRRGSALTVSLPVSKATIASRLSLTPEYFSRVLHELESAGLIEIDKRDIRILDSKRLAAYQPVG